MRKILIYFRAIFLFVVVFMTVGVARAGEIDLLVQKLIEKGVLSPLEGQILIDETKADVAKQIANKEHSTLPSWIQSLKLKGDLRLRYQYERDPSDTESKQRLRLRYRLGIEGKVTNTVKVGAGIASGDDDPRSTNQDLVDTFETGDVRLDYAYAEWFPRTDLNIIGGKFKFADYLWTPTDMLWDSDITPSGVSAHFSRPIPGTIIPNMEYWLNSGIWVMDEQNHTDRIWPYVFVNQAGLNYREEKEAGIAWDGKLAFNSYTFGGVKGACLDFGAGSNTGTNVRNTAKACTSGGYTYDYDSIGSSAEIGVQRLFGGLPFNIDGRIALLGDYIQNVDDVDENTGWTVGAKFGSANLKIKGDWQARYTYTKLGRDAWLDTFPDSDRRGGATNIFAHEIVLEYALAKGIILGVDYYQNSNLVGTADTDHLLQLDWLFKF